MLRLALIFTTLFSGIYSAAHATEVRHWTLRFDHRTSHIVAQSGCYGTASYRYQLPTADQATAFREALADKADEHNLGGYVFTSSVRDGDRLVMDLDSGDLKSLGSQERDGIVFCICREEYTYTDACSPANLEPLGHPFLATDDGSDAHHAETSWVDPVTGHTWSFASPAANWWQASTICQEAGAALPDRPVLTHAANRIYNSPLGRRIVEAQSRIVWSADEFDPWQGIYVYVPRGDAAATGKRELLPVLCYQEGNNG